MPDYLHDIIILTDKTNITVVGAKHCENNCSQNLKDRASNASPLHLAHYLSINIQNRIGKIMRYNRKSIRLRGWDYSRPGMYFVTICVQGGACLFGRVKNQKMELNIYGQIANSIWTNIPRHFKNAQLDVFQIMPNHLHGIIILTDQTNIMVVGAKNCGNNCSQNLKDRAGNASPLRIPYQSKPVHPAGTQPGSISAIIQNFISITTRKINKIRKTPGEKLWQRGYYDHIIRNEYELWAIRRYIMNNPKNWQSKYI